MALRELLARFGFEVDTKALDKAGQATSKAVDQFAGLGSALAGAALIGGTYLFAQSLVELGSELDDQSNRLGISSDALQAWRFAAGQGGASAEELGSGLKILTKNLAEAATAGQAELLPGVKIKNAAGEVKDATAVISDIADAIGKAKTNTEKGGIALKAFGKGGLALLPMLKDGKEGVKALMDRFQELGGGLSQQFVHAADEAGDAQEELKIGVLSLKDKLGVHLLPAVTWVTHKLTDFVIGIQKATANTNVMKVGLGVLGAAALVAALEFAPLLLEVLAVAIPLALLALLVEDVYTMMTGGHSAIGEFIDGMFGVGATATVVDYLKQAWDNCVMAVKAVWPAIEFLGKQTAIFLKDVFSGFQGYGTMFEEFFHFVWEDIKKGLDAVLDYFISKVPGLKMVLGGLSDGYKAVFGNTEDQANPALLARRASVGTIQVPGAGAGVTQNNNVELNVNGAGDPGAVAGKAATILGTQNQQNLNALGAMARP